MKRCIFQFCKILFYVCQSSMPCSYVLHFIVAISTLIALNTECSKKEVTTLIGCNKSVGASTDCYLFRLHSQLSWICQHVFVFHVFQTACKYYSISCKMYMLQQKLKIVHLWYETKLPAEVQHTTGLQIEV